MSSRGEMKISLRLMTCCLFSEVSRWSRKSGKAYVLVAQVLEQLQLTVCALGQDRRAEGLHDLLDCDGRSSELILGRAVPGVSACPFDSSPECNSPYKPESTHTHRLQIRVPVVSVSPCSSRFLPSSPSPPFSRARAKRLDCPYLLVISKVVPKIWARTNSAMVKDFCDYLSVVGGRRRVGDDGGDEVGGGSGD
jgi:hypothetical protein